MRARIRMYRDVMPGYMEGGRVLTTTLSLPAALALTATTPELRRDLPGESRRQSFHSKP